MVPTRVYKLCCTRVTRKSANKLILLTRPTRVTKVETTDTPREYLTDPQIECPSLGRLVCGAVTASQVDDYGAPENNTNTSKSLPASKEIIY